MERSRRLGRSAGRLRSEDEVKVRQEEAERRLGPAGFRLEEASLEEVEGHGRLKAPREAELGEERSAWPTANA